MITRIEGVLESIGQGRAVVNCGALAYEVLVPACDATDLEDRVGERMVFHTLSYLENQNQGAAYVPRLIGFSSPRDRQFFELFTTVKGIGNRRALRAMQLPCGTIAAAIAERDIALLVSLPEIGKRTAESIIVELHGKVDAFAGAALSNSGTGRAGKASAMVEPGGARAGRSLVNDALNVLTQLGEQRLTARQLIDRALAADPEIATADALVAAAFRLRES